MLVLSRKLGESILIADQIVLKVLSIKGTQVKIGITAPLEIPIHREEVYYRIEQEQVTKK